MKTYTRQNKIQKEILSILNLLNKDYRKIWELESNGLKVYTPHRNKLKLGFIGLLVVGCLITPATNLFIIPLLKWSLK